MGVRHVLFVASVCAGAAALVLTASCTQGQPPAPAGEAASPAQTPQVHGNLAQVMRGIVFPSANVIFVAQSEDPVAIKPADDPAVSPNPLTSTYGGWDAVSNAGIALAEAANLLIIPGRMCMNGRPAPIQNADWQKWVGGLREAGMTAEKAGQAKNMDAVLSAADVMSTACQNCHEKYRDVTGGIPARCQ